MIRLRTDSIAVAPQTALLGVGWTILPTYTVIGEIERRSLAELPIEWMGRQKFGLWWHAERPRPQQLLMLLEKELPLLNYSLNS